MSNTCKCGVVIDGCPSAKAEHLGKEHGIRVPSPRERNGIERRNTIFTIWFPEKAEKK